MTHRRAAFTLIELIASAVLAAMMMAALLNIAWSALRETTQLRTAEVRRASATLLAEQMRTDFQNARGMRVDAMGVTLHGFLDRDRSTAGTLLLPATVRYEAAIANGHRVLVRRAGGESDPQSDPVWYRFARLTVDPLVEDDPESGSLAAPETGGLPPIPAIFRVTLIGDRSQVIWREVIHHHEG